MDIALNINNQDVVVKDVKPYERLIDVLRNRLNLLGTKRGCDTGGCGACTIVMDGKAVYACLTLAAASGGKKILTIEGLSEDGELHPLQKSMIRHGAIQCGYCTPGVTMSLYPLLEKEAEEIDEDVVKETLSGNICRCTGYKKIVEAAKEVLANGSK